MGHHTTCDLLYLVSTTALRVPFTFFILSIHALTRASEEYPDSWFRIFAASAVADSINIEEPSLIGGRFLGVEKNRNVLVNGWNWFYLANI